MSFLNQLKSQASALQQKQGADLALAQANTVAVETACKTAWLYVSDLAKQLNILAPSAPALSLDGRTLWPDMKLVDFRADARKKKLRDQEVYDYIAVGWRIVPAEGQPLGASVSANFVPDLERIESRLSAGGVKHERIHVRHPEKNTLKEYRFDYVTEARGSLTITANHDDAALAFRLGCVTGFQIIKADFKVDELQTSLLDELAKMLVGQPSTFCVVP